MQKMIKPKERLKVCFFNLFSYPLFNPKSKINFGGTEVQLSLMAKELAKDKNFEVSFLMGGAGGQPAQELISKVKIYKAVNVLPRRNYFLKGLCLFLKSLCLCFKINPDILVFSPEGLPTLPFYLYAKLMHKKIVARINNDPMTNPSQIANLKYKDVFNNFQYRFTLFWQIKNSNFIIAQNNKQVQNLNKFFKFYKIGIAPNIYEIGRKADLENKQFILWVGKMSQLKRPQLFIELAKRFPKEKFVMIASSYGHEFEKNIEREAEKLKNLKLVYSVPFHEVDDYFKKAKLLVNTSEWEGFPNTFVQASKNGTPILSFKANPNNILNKYRIGFCAKGKFNKLISYTHSLLKNTLLWQEMSQNTYKYAKENYDIRKKIKEIKEILISL